MAFLGLPLLHIDFLKPQRMSFDNLGNALGGGRNAFGQEASFDLSGGGFVTATYGGCWVQSPEEHEYVTWLAAYLNGSYRYIDVPLKTDWQGPFPTFGRFPQPIVSGIPHSDGSPFSDGSGYSQATVWGEVVKQVNSGVLRMRVFNASRPLRWSDWFSIYHPGGKGWRAYRYWKIVEDHGTGQQTVAGTTYPYREYTLAIGPALREAIELGSRIEFARPRFSAKLKPGTSVSTDIEGFWVTRPTLQFEEAFN